MFIQLYTNLRNHHFGKCSHLKILYIIGYIAISWTPMIPIPESGRCDPKPSKDWRQCTSEHWN